MFLKNVLFPFYDFLNLDRMGKNIGDFSRIVVSAADFEEEQRVGVKIAANALRSWSDRWFAQRQSCLPVELL